jgi:hypothetical protein
MNSRDFRIAFISGTFDETKEAAPSQNLSRGRTPWQAAPLEVQISDFGIS